jgi:lipopolysaccharide/colanic/teichoic acid biosynthesis glycosyltransferase
MRLIIYRLFALIALILLSPLIILACILVIVLTHDPNPFFIQKRLGKDKKIFFIYKIKTMIKGAEALKKKYLHLNEYFPPIFKLHNDPRYTSIGRVLAHFHIDELPQLINIIKGEMSWIGPRPLPVEEAQKIPSEFIQRFNVLPGLVPPSIVEGRKALCTVRWLELDKEYAENNSINKDIHISLCVLQKVIFTKHV